MLLPLPDHENFTDSVTYRLLKDFSLPLLAIVWAIYSYLRQSRRRLSIRQVGDEFSDSVAYWESGMTSYSIEIAITNDSPHAAIVIAWYDIELPWNEEGLEPLIDPKQLDDPSDFYRPPGKGIQVHRDEVLNHRRYQYGKLGPGEAFRGYYLAKGQMPIPDDLAPDQKRRYIEAQFVVQDTTGKVYKAPIYLHPRPAISI